MFMKNRFAVILAAGKGTRMKSKLYKVLHPVMGRPMVQHVIKQLQPVELEEIVTIVGFGAEQVSEVVGETSKFAIQKEQLGTGHAVQQAEDVLGSRSGTTIVVCGDTPLITAETFQALFDHHEQNGAKATILTAQAEVPAGYGRVIRDETGEVSRIVEHKDANTEELKVNEINTGTYCFDNELLFAALKNVSNENAQGEYYLPDVIEILRSQGEKVTAFMTPDFHQTLGVNDRVALAEAEKIMRKRVNEFHMRAGVSIIDPDNTYIGPDVKIGLDTVVYPGTVISGETEIGEESVIGPNSEIDNCIIGDSTVVKHSVLKDSRVGSGVNIGPFAHLRPDSDIGDEAKIGNFVEIKKSQIGHGSKISHLSYIGDSEVGEKVNVGCGTITVNYDGQKKFATKIEDEAFIGCNSNLVAPVLIGKGAYVAAGSTITANVPADALSIARSRQTNKEGYALKLKKD